MGEDLSSINSRLCCNHSQTSETLNNRGIVLIVMGEQWAVFIFVTQGPKLMAQALQRVLPSSLRQQKKLNHVLTLKLSLYVPLAKASHLAMPHFSGILVCACKWRRTRNTGRNGTDGNHREILR